VEKNQFVGDKKRGKKEVTARKRSVVRKKAKSAKDFSY